MANTVFLRLEGPLQSWGERARWGVRDTAPEPTKSGVVGLLGCALGIRNDHELRNLSRQIRLGIRCDRPGVMRSDYHTVIGGVLSAEGKVKITASTKEIETVVSRRMYLCDASFVAAVQSKDDSLINTIFQALRSPHWPIYLGRKSCPPSSPILAGVGDFPDLLTALISVRCFVRENAGPIKLRVVIESESSEGIRRRDEIDLNSCRTFLPRYTLEDLILIQAELTEA